MQYLDFYIIWEYVPSFIVSEMTDWQTDRQAYTYIFSIIFKLTSLSLSALIPVVSNQACE